MEPKVLEFLKSHNVGALAVLLPDGTPHNAALHYSHEENPLRLYFSTENTSRKCQGLLKGETVKGAFVVGLSEDEWITVQMEGTVKAVERSELEKVQDVHYAKHPNSAKFKDEPETIFLAFTPTWWRFTDYNTTPMSVLSSHT